MSPPTPPKAPARTARHARRGWRLNLRAVAILAVVLALTVAGLVLSQALRPAADRTHVEQARRQLEAGRGDLALSHLNEALRRDPRNVAALNLKADLLTKSARRADDLNEALNLGDRALRLAPDGPDSQAIRRRQIEILLLLAPSSPEPRLRYEVADKLAADLLEKGAQDAEAYRLAARVKEGLAEHTEGGASDKAVDDALGYYVKACEADPTDVASAERRAIIYRDKKKDSAKALEILDELVETAPKSADARLARARYFADQARRAEAANDRRGLADAQARTDEEMDRAVALEPDRFEIRLLAADYQLRRGRPELAREHLAALSEEARKDPRVRAIEGLSHLQQNRTDRAIEDWRQGLLLSNGTDAELTWRLAWVLLQAGRVAEAEPLLEQYRRLAGQEEPGSAYLFLAGLRQLRLNRPAEAIGLLDRARRGVPPTLAALLEFALGQCYEATRDEERALEQYARAAAVDPKLPAPRLARIRLLQARRPAEARDELRRALDALGDEPGLLVSLARMEYRDQLRRPRERRDWSEVRGLVERAARLAPASSAVALLQADLLSAEGRDGEAVALLEQAAGHQKADPDLWLARAERLARAGLHEQALLVLEQAMAPEAAGDQAALRVARARLLSLRGRGREAREELVRDLDRLPPDQRPAVWKALGDLHAAQRNPDEARRAYAQWADALPDDPLPRLFLLELALAADDRAAADAQIAALKGLGGQGGLYWRVARVQELLRPVPGEGDEAREARLAEAERLVAQVESESREQRFGYMLRGRLHEVRGEKAEAAEAYEEALRHDGGATALQRLVQLYSELGRPADLNRLRREHGAEVPALDRALAEAALQVGDAARAAELARQVVEGEPESLDARVWHARLLNTAGRAEEAEASLRQLVARQPDQLGPRLALLMFLAGRDGRAAEAAKVAGEIVGEVRGLEQPEFVHAQCWRIAKVHDKAEAAYRAALARWPEDARVVRGAADYFEAAGRPADAEAILRGALEHEPMRRWASRSLALLRSARVGDEAAWREALDLVGAEPSESDTVEDRLARGIVLARGPEDGHRRRAREILGPLLRDLPADVPSAAVARQVLLQLDLQAGEVAEAADLAAVDARAPNAGAPAISRYAELLLAAGRLDETERQVARLEAGAPADLGTIVLRARLLKARGRADEAAARLLKAFDDRAGDPDARDVGRRLLGLLLEIDPKAAEDLARRMAASWPAAAWMVATVVARQGRHEEALALYRDAAAAAETADLRELARGIATAVGAAPRKDERLLALADEAVAAALAREPDATDLLVTRGFVLHLQGRYDEEVRLYQAALEKNPDDLAFLNNLAWTLCEGLDRPREALAWIERAFARSPRPAPQFRDTRGVIYTRLGRLDEAIADLEAAARGRPSGTVLAHLARAYHLADRPEKFREARDRARELKLKPEDLEPRDRRDLAPLLFGDETALGP